MNFSMRRGGAVLGAVLVMTMAFAVTAHAAGPKDEKKAIQSFAAGRYDEALEIYAKLYADTLNPVYLRNIGRCHQKLKQPDKAIESFHDYLEKGKNISADEKAQIDGYIKEMEALRDEQARAQQPAAPPGPTPLAPAPPAPVQPIQSAPPPAPGSSAPPPGYAMQPGGAYPPAPPPYQSGPDQPAGTLVAQPPPPESEPVYTKWWFWTIIGVVVVGGVVTAVALSSGTSKPPCPPTALVCM
jgi:hypothetical protein